MTEAEWLASADAGAMVRAPEAGVAPDGRKLRLFLVACCRAVWDHVTDSRIRRLVEVSEQVADGTVKPDVLFKPFHKAQEVITADRYKARTDPAYRRRAELAEAVRTACGPSSGWWELSALPGLATGSGAAEQARLARDVFGNPFRPVSFSPSWRTDTVLSLARQMYESGDFSAMPILADALQDAGCDNEAILSHCRGDGPHVRGCWVVDLVLGKE